MLETMPASAPTKSKTKKRQSKPVPKTPKPAAAAPKANANTKTPTVPKAKKPSVGSQHLKRQSAPIATAKKQQAVRRTAPPAVAAFDDYGGIKHGIATKVLKSIVAFDPYAENHNVGHKGDDAYTQYLKHQINAVVRKRKLS
jgi:hypothetical protein